MHARIRNLTHAAIIAGLYAALTHLQNLLLPGSASWAIQCRISEALCVLALFTPAAIPGLSVGCLLFNLTFGAALPLDWLLGTAATLCAAAAMRQLRGIRLFGHPFAAMMMPALFNGMLVGWELTLYVGGGFVHNALYVALGEIIAMFAPGSVLYWLIVKRGLDRQLFS